MKGQMSIMDWMPSALPEPEVGDYIREPGPVICHIMRRGYIGKKVCFDVSTESFTSLYRVGILEKVIDVFYYRRVGDEYVMQPCDRSVIFDGKKQRTLITHMPGHEIHEVLPR